MEAFLHELDSQEFLCSLNSERTGKIKKRLVRVDESEQFIHPNFMPAIISTEDFEQVKEIFESRLQGRVKTGHDRVHRYAGLLRCATCGKGFVARMRRAKNGDIRVVYNCSTHFRYGASFCTPHIVNERDLDNVVFGKLREALYYGELNQAEIDIRIELKQMNSQPRIESLEELKEEILQKRSEVKEYARQLARHLIDDELYQELVNETQDMVRVLENRLEEMKKAVVNADNEKHNVLSCLTRIRSFRQRAHYQC